MAVVEVSTFFQIVGAFFVAQWLLLGILYLVIRRL